MSEVKAESFGFGTLAALTVRGGKLESASWGVTYDPATGVVGFLNPLNLTFVPVISDLAGSPDHYLTSTHFIREIGESTHFRVWATALDTGNRNYPPSDFTAIVIGFAS